ncbi:protein translocase subunit SecF [Candidatus Gottesmanbacteria bacterium]|nr:protein translocase subunit SecF [Candidatus Gottesmanbacteria bacterium]
MIDIIGKKWFYFLISGLIIIPGLVSLLFFGLRLSIDFTGGTLLEFQILKFNPPAGGQIKNEEIKKIIEEQKIESGLVQNSGENTFLLRLKPIDQSQNKKLQEELSKKLGEVKELRFETVGPTIGKELTRKAILAIIVASVMIVLYIAWSFRTVPKPYSSIKFGVCAVAALLHDVLVLVGTFSIFGHFFKVEIDSLFVTALLTVIGFSVHDTIVVFDRIRENLKRLPNKSFAEVTNESIIQTLGRSLSTSLTVIFTLSSLFLFGGATIKWFVVALLIGIVSGTYSSIFNAAPLLVLWEERKNSSK